ncbi:RluA family pseudouridine synthase [Treponema pedis]|uniref:RluA family pseudouridine synthase n=1 Tax=Treponema pedis TaxID=409322 RepID=UPI001CEF6096|nr:RluA family pseudouridine synthase [Treponema pedis]
MVYNIKMNGENGVFIIAENDEGRRIDRILRKFLAKTPLSRIYSAIRTGKIKINGRKCKPDYITVKGDKLEIRTAFFNEDNGKKCGFYEKIPVVADSEEKPAVILRTNDLLFINKKNGEIVHGEKSLCQAVLKHFPGTENSLAFTSGPLHRLDKNTSGIITFSQSLKGAQKFSRALKEDKIEKYYLGIIEGINIKKELKSIIDGKDCFTLAEPLAVLKSENIALVRFKLITGRKHQIRIQCSRLGTPLLNDIKYGSKQSFHGAKSYFLHAYKLRFKERLFDDVPDTITAALPEDFSLFLKKFGDLSFPLNFDS